MHATGQKIPIDQRVDGGMQMTAKDEEAQRSRGQRVRSRGTGRSGYVLDLSVRRRLELLSERFLAKAEPSYRPNLEAGDKVSAGLCLSPR